MGNKFKPSVTQILDYSIPPQLGAWYKNNSKDKCERIGNEAARIGTLVDDLIQQDINEGGYVPPEQDTQALNCLGGWELVKKEHPLFVPSVKRMQVELEIDDLIGHFDYDCQEENGWGITDLKCTSGIRFKNYVQCATYARMIMELEKRKFPSFIRIIRLMRDNPNNYEWSEIRDPKMIQYFMDLFGYYRGIFDSELFLKEYFLTKAEDELLGEF